jgi:hypothetical protein
MGLTIWDEFLGKQDSRDSGVPSQDRVGFPGSRLTIVLRDAQTGQYGGGMELEILSFIVSLVAAGFAGGAVLYARRQAVAAREATDIQKAEAERQKNLVSFRWTGDTPSIVNEGTAPVMLLEAMFRRFSNGTTYSHPFGEPLEAGARVEFTVSPDRWVIEPSDRVAVSWHASGGGEKSWEGLVGQPR